MTEQSAQCIIVGAGTFEKERFLRVVALCDHPYIIACDAGYAHLDSAGITPDLIVGDFDSVARLDASYLERICDIERDTPERVIRLPVVKDDTDLMRAIREGLDKGFTSYALFGTLGGERFSLSVASLQSLTYLSHHGAQGVLYDAGCTVTMLTDGMTINLPGGSQNTISLFAMSEAVHGLTIEGLQYTLRDATLTHDFPLGVSNHFLPEKAASIRIGQGTLLVVEEPPC